MALKSIIRPHFSLIAGFCAFPALNELCTPTILDRLTIITSSYTLTILSKTHNHKT